MGSAEIEEGYDAGRPFPWRWLVIGAAGLLVAGTGYVAAKAFFETTPAEDDSSTAEGPGVRPGSIVPEPLAPNPSERHSAFAQATTPQANLEGGDVAAGQGIPVEPASGDPGAPQPEEAGAGQPVVAEEAKPAELPPELEARVGEARSLYKSGATRKLGQAQEILQEVLASAPQHPEALTLLAQIQLERGKLEDALATATTCTEVAPQVADCWLTVGVIQQEKRQKQQAVHAYERYLALAPNGQYAGDIQKQLDRLR
jgi:TolA-binding protein